ncbi:hypothetical protein RchiOBHm_Chr4g0389151 [Rosa chinensis]|uniref:Uncharacterized protein n=1 Tax=Rosa chinensis TaxID=74649 RepID=A0A2P6QPX5_ROSCH|nr:hypothetical protein RchiOBHm_Chr4g0389151 [Rosa chinensis]
MMLTFLKKKELVFNVFKDGINTVSSYAFVEFASVVDSCKQALIICINSAAHIQ